MHWTRSRVLALLVVLTGVVFALWVLALRSPLSPWYVARWGQVGQGLERIEFISSNNVDVLLYRFRPDQFALRLEQRSEPLKVNAWAQALEGETVVINGVYFLEDHTPAGLLITDGQTISGQEFDLDKSGVIRFEPNFALLDTSNETFSTFGVVEAAQSFPFLLKQGAPAIKEDSGLTARRTFIGTDVNGLVYVGVVWRDSLSLFELMNTLTEMEIDWDNVINLDGGPSTGIALETDSFVETLDSAAPVPNVIVVQAK